MQSQAKHLLNMKDTL